VDSIPIERLLDDPGDSAAVNEPNRAFPVGPGPHRLVETANPLERCAAYGRMRAEAPVQDRRTLIVDVEGARLPKTAHRTTVDLV
jgi:hypothetical protein